MSIQKFNDFSEKLSSKDIEEMFLNIFDIVDDFNEDYGFNLNVTIEINYDWFLRSNPCKMHLKYNHDSSVKNSVLVYQINDWMNYINSEDPKISDCIDLILNYCKSPSISLVINVINDNLFDFLKLDLSKINNLTLLKNRISDNFIIKPSSFIFIPSKNVLFTSEFKFF